MNFSSDNVTGASPEIIEAIKKANFGSASPYGGDKITQQVMKMLQDIFESTQLDFQDFRTVSSFPPL